MNKSPDKRGPNPFEQAHKKSLRVFLNFLKFLEVKRSFIKSGREVGQLCDFIEEQDSLMETCKKFSRNKPPY